MGAILDELASRARSTLRDAFLDEHWPGILAKSGPNGALRSALTRWAETDPIPLVLLLDEIDTLIGDTLLSVLRQLRAGYDRRPEGLRRGCRPPGGVRPQRRQELGREDIPLPPRVRRRRRHPRMGHVTERPIRRRRR
ncbi:MAG: hypothetical protein OXJ62_03455 [Spirochaetaceae bacterium]|nr:hypothetical protein [Spirochaetaceae bacterium]